MDINGQPLPVLEIPTVRLIGKDGVECGQQLHITAQLGVTLSLDGECVHAPVFVQPNSSQPCLLGMNVIPGLGIKVMRASGEGLCGLPNCESEATSVSLVASVAIPSRRGYCIEAKNNIGKA